MISQNRARAEAERLAAAFFFVHDLFRPPSAEQWRHLHEERTREIWAALCAALRLDEEMRLPDSPSIFEEEYATSFGTGSHAIPLRESRYRKSRAASGLIEENTRIYETFGLRLKDGEAQTADDLRRQLEFVGYLCRLEAGAHLRSPATPDRPATDHSGRQLRTTREPDAGAAGQRAPKGPELNLPRQILLARREYLRRHLLSWLPAALSRAERGRTAWVRAFLLLTLRLIEEAEAS